jgi:hypothetical protein
MSIDLAKILGKSNPHTIRVVLADGQVRDLKVPVGTRKRWTGVLSIIEKLEWSRLEMLDQRGAVLDLIDHPDSAGRPADRFAVSATDDPAERNLKNMIAAQREALTWQDKSVRAALDTCVAVMREQAEAVRGIVEMHRMQADGMRQMLRELQAELAAGAGPEPGSDMPQAELLKAMLPMLASKLLAGAAPAPAPRPTPTVVQGGKGA